MSGIGDFVGLMKNARQVMDKAKVAQAALAKQTVTGTAGAGLVTVDVNGVGELIGLKLERSVVNPDDVELLSSLIVAAVADAREKTAHLKAEYLHSLTGGIDLSALGLDLSNIM